MFLREHSKSHGFCGRVANSMILKRILSTETNRRSINFLHSSVLSKICPTGDAYSIVKVFRKLNLIKTILKNAESTESAVFWSKKGLDILINIVTAISFPTRLVLKLQRNTKKTTTNGERVNWLPFWSSCSHEEEKQELICGLVKETWRVVLCRLQFDKFFFHFYVFCLFRRRSHQSPHLYTSQSNHKQSSCG